MTWLMVSLASGEVACSCTIHPLSSRVNVRSTCMSKLCSGVLRNKGNDEQGEAESQKREIAHAQQVGGAWGGGHLAKGVTDDHGCRGAITRLLTLLSFQKALGWITTPRTRTRELRH